MQKLTFKLLKIIFTLVLLINVVFLIGCVPLMDTFDFLFGEAADSHDPEFPPDVDDETKKEIKEALSEAEQELGEQRLDEGLEEVEKLLPNNPTDYKGNIDGVRFSMTIDFQTATVIGELNMDGDDYAQAKMNGSIKIETLSVEMLFSGVVGSKKYGQEYPWSGMITGYLSEDLQVFNGVLIDDEDTVVEFIASQ